MTQVIDRLLREVDPAPAELINGDSESDIVFVCEHAGREIPAALGDLGLPPDKMNLHIAYDIGAASLARLLADHFNAPLVMQPYSRLVIDCNRPIDVADSIPAISDGVTVPGNEKLMAEDRERRVKEIFDPFQSAITALLDHPPRRAVFALHSFTPVLGEDRRPWDVGFLYRNDAVTSEALAATIRRLDPSLSIGMNQPYTIDDTSDWFVPHHGEKRGLAHSLIEVRNDHLMSEEGLRRWAGLLSIAITELLGKDPT